MQPLVALLLLLCPSLTLAWKWSAVSTADDGTFTPRFGAATAIWPQSGSDPDRLIICGGAEAVTGNATLLADCNVLLPELNSQPWVLKQLAQAPFAARRDFTIIAYSNYLLVYGGNSTAEGRSLAYPTVLQIGAWNTLEASFLGDVPAARYGHAAVLSPLDSRSWIIFGGCALSDGSLLQDVAVLDLGTASGLTPSFTFTTASINVVGTKPSGRKYHGMASYGSSVYVVGGQTATGAAASDVFALRLGGSSSSSSSGAGVGAGVGLGSTWTWVEQPSVYAVPVYGHALISATVTAPASSSSSSSSSSSAPAGGILVLYGAVTTGGARIPSAEYQANGGVMTLSLVDWNWRTPAVSGAPGGGNASGYGGAFLPGSGLLTKMQGVDSDTGSSRWVVFGGALPPPAASSSSSATASDAATVAAGASVGLFAALEQIGVNPQPSKNTTLPIILGSVAVALFLILGAGGLVWWRRGLASNKAASAGDTVPRLKTGPSSIMLGGGGGGGGSERSHLLPSPASVFYGGNNHLHHNTSSVTHNASASMGMGMGMVYGSPATVRNGGMVGAGAGNGGAAAKSFFGSVSATPYSADPGDDDEDGYYSGNLSAEVGAAQGQQGGSSSKKKKGKKTSFAVSNDVVDDAAAADSYYSPVPTTTASSSSALSYTQRLLQHQFYPPPPISEGAEADALEVVVGRGQAAEATFEEEEDRREEDEGVNSRLGSRAISSGSGNGGHSGPEDELRF